MDGLLDTAILIDLDRGFAPALAWAKSAANLQYGITPIVWLEMVQGVENKRQQQRVIRFLNQFEMVHLTQDDQVWTLEQFRRYQLSHNIGIMDCLIAAPCHRLNLPLMTRNSKHFTPLLDKLVQTPY